MISTTPISQACHQVVLSFPKTLRIPAVLLQGFDHDTCREQGKTKGQLKYMQPFNSQLVKNWKDLPQGSIHIEHNPL